MTRRYIAVDLGQVSGQVVLVTFTDGKPEMETVYCFPMPSLRMAGKLMWNIYSIFDEVLRGLSMIGERNLPIESIGVDSWNNDFVCTAKDGSFIGLPRSGEGSFGQSSLQKFFKRMSASEYYCTAGVHDMDSGTAFQLFARHREKDLALENARSIMFISDALVYLLTGKKCCDSTQLSAAGLMNVCSGKLAKDVLKVCHVKSKRFPSLTVPGVRLSRLTEEVAEATGLGRIYVASVSGSATASEVSVLPMEDEASAYLHIGEGSFMGIEVTAPVINDRMLEMGFSNELVSEGRYMIRKRLPGLGALRACLAEWKREGKSFTEEELHAELESVSPASSLLDLGDPSLSPCKDMTSAVRKYCTSRDMAAPADDASVARLIYESFADSCGDAFRRLQGISPFRLKSLYVTGPCAGDGFLNRLIANECAVPVTAVQGGMTALGNAAAQAGLDRKALSGSIVTQSYRPQIA